jgi:cyclic pyranopterin phosphate synthase
MSDLTHVGRDGKARMVDVGSKPVTDRLARATGTIRMQPETLAKILANEVAKGDVLGVARIAGIMGAKRTSDLVPLCHPIPISDIQIEITPDADIPGLRVDATVCATGRTGVEMEALTAVTVTLITIYDMAKGVEKGMVMAQISLTEKAGGKSGHWSREAP